MVISTTIKITVTADSIVINMNGKLISPSSIESISTDLSTNECTMAVVVRRPASYSQVAYVGNGPQLTYRKGDPMYHKRRTNER